MRISLTCLLLFAACPFFILPGCKKSDQSSFGKASFPAADFSLAVGDQWVYRVTDYYTNATDTLILSVTRLQAFPDGSKKYRCDIIQKAAVVDSGAYSISNNILTYQGLNPNQYSYFGNFKLQFSFGSGSQWIGFYPADTVKVISELGSTKILGKAYLHVFSLKRGFALLGNYSMVQFILIAPGVGIINQSINLFDGGPGQNQSFELISYTLH